MKRELRIDTASLLLLGAGTAETSVDVINHNSGILAVTASGATTLVIEHSDDDSVWANAPAALLADDGAIAGAGDVEFDLKVASYKRYVRVKSNASITVAAVVLGDKDYMATAAEVKN